MSFRFMRILLFFDLPMETAKERKVYTQFRKFLTNEGFIMMQKSVYSKLALNNSIVNSVREKVYKNKPKRGIIQILTITEKQFTSIEYVLGQKTNNILDNSERIIMI